MADSDLLTLLHRRYGFHPQRHRAGHHKFEWRRKQRPFMVLELEIPYNTRADRAQVAEALGLTSDQLTRAAANPDEFSVHCLLFVLIARHVIRSRRSQNKDHRSSVCSDGMDVLGDFEGQSFSDCSLVENIAEECRALAHSEDPSYVAFGKRALALTAQYKK